MHGGSVPETIIATMSVTNTFETRSLLGYLRASVDRYPEAEAIVHGERRMRYGELWGDLSALARYLREHGLARGDRVALLLENSYEYVVAYYAVLAAGGVVVALNAAARARDLTNWIEHCEAGWLIAHREHGELGSMLAALDSRVRIVAVGGALPDTRAHAVWSDILRDRGEAPAGVDLAPDATAAIIYTSGTTGRPKGVTLSHGNLASNVRSILAYLELSANDRCLNVLPFYYSYGNSVLHTHLAVGGALVLENSLAYVHNVVSKIAHEAVTGFAGVPSTYALIASRVDMTQYDCRSLRYATQAGGAMRPALIEHFRRAWPKTRFFVMYGQTEATARLTYLPPERLEQKLGSAGIPIPDVRIEIRDETGAPVPVGSVGEIYASGPNVMQGYWNDPRATEQVLRDGWLKTGDLALMDEDGYVYIQGRSSDMIKTGAHRINPADIEEVIAELDGVAEVAAVGVPDEILGQVVKAVIVAGAPTAPTATAIKAHCHARLASYKVPRQVEFVAQLPKTASGKIRRYLLANETSERVRGNEH